MKNKANIVFYNLCDNKKLKNSICDYFSENEKVTIWKKSNLTEVDQIISSNQNGILLFKLETKAELVQMLRFLRKYKDLNNSGMFKCICFIKNANQKLNNIFEKYHCYDVLLLSANPKTITHKLENWLKNFEALQNEQIGQEGISVSDNKNNKNEPPESFNRFDNWLNDLLSDALGNKLPRSKDQEELSKIFTPPDINLESGKISIELKQKSDDQYIHYLCKLKELLEDSVWLTIPKGSKFLEKPLYLKLNLEYSGEKITIESEVEISETEEYDDTHDCIQFSLSNANTQSINTFFKLIQKRQDSIDEFMERAKGYK